MTFEQLANPVTAAQARAILYTILARLGLATTSWKPGAVVRTIVAALAIVLAAMSTLVANILKSGFWRLAAGEWLTQTALYLCGVRRRTATFASGTLTLTNASANVYTVAPRDASFAHATTNKTYRNAAAFTLGASSTVTIAIIADELGSASSAFANTITVVVSAMPGVTCANSASVVGVDDELDASVQRRCDSAAASASPNGARAAYARFAMFDINGDPLLKPDGTAVDVNRVHVSHSSVTGLVTVTVAGAAGPVSGTVDDPTTDLGAAHANIQINAVTYGVTETTQTVSLFPIAINYALVVDSTILLTNAQIYDAAIVKLLAVCARYPIGGYLVGANRYVFLEDFRVALKSIDEKVLNASVSLPTSDQVIGEHQVPVLGTVTQSGVTRIVVG